MYHVHGSLPACVGTTSWHLTTCQVGKLPKGIAVSLLLVSKHFMPASCTASAPHCWSPSLHVQRGPQSHGAPLWHVRHKHTLCASIYYIRPQQAACGTPFVAGGDDSAAFVLPHQLQELVVLAGLDPAAPPVVKLMGLMQERAAGRAAAHGEAKLYLDEFLGVVCFFREKPLEVLQHEQGKQAAAEAAMKAAAAAAVCWGDDSTPGAATGSAAGAAQGDESGAWQQQDGLAEEVWQQDNEIAANEEAKQATAATRLSEPGWGAAGDELMLERHIAQHRGSSASHSAATAAEPGYAAAAAAGPVEAMPGLASTADTEVAGQPGSVFEGAGQPGSV